MPESNGQNSQPQQQPAPAAPTGAPDSPAAPPPQMEEAIGRHLVEAFKTLAFDPVGKMTEAYQALGPRRATALGATFGVAFLVCSLIGAAIARHLNPDTGWRLGNRTDLTAKETIAIIVFGAVLVGAMALGGLIFRSMTKGGGGFGQDLYAAGLAAYPLCPMVLLAGLTVNMWSHLISYAALSLGGIYLVITYYTAGTDILGLNKRTSAMMTAVVLLVTTGVINLVSTAFR